MYMLCFDVLVLRLNTDPHAPMHICISIQMYNHFLLIYEMDELR